MTCFCSCFGRTTNSGAAVVHPLRADHVPPRRHDPRDGHEVRRRARGLQYVPSPTALRRRARLTPCAAWLIELAGGAVADFDDSCLPKSQREASFTIAAFHQWDLGVDDPRCIAIAEEVCRPPPRSRNI